jgi:hypothetical protein
MVTLRVALLVTAVSFACSQDRQAGTTVCACSHAHAVLHLYDVCMFAVAHAPCPAAVCYEHNAALCAQWLSTSSVLHPV